MMGISSVVYPRSTVLSLRGKFQYTLSLFASVKRCLLQFLKIHNNIMQNAVRCMISADRNITFLQLMIKPVKTRSKAVARIADRTVSQQNLQIYNQKNGRCV